MVEPKKSPSVEIRQSMADTLHASGFHPDAVNAVLDAYNAFDSAAKRLGVNAVELAERMADGGIAGLYSALRDAQDLIQRDGEAFAEQEDDGDKSARATTLETISVELARVK